MRVVGLVLISITASAAHGCGSESHKELRAANERIKDLEKLTSEGEARIKELQAERDSAKAEAKAAMQQASDKHKEEIERLKKAHDDELSANRGISDQRIAAMQTDKFALQMQLSNSEKELMALKGLIDQPERLKVIQEGNCSIERAIWICLVGATLAISGLYASQYFHLRAKRREDVVRLIGQLSEHPA